MTDATRTDTSQPQLVVAPDYDTMSSLAADEVQAVLFHDPTVAISLPTGTTPLGLFKELIDRCRAGSIDLTQMQLFCLDEYLGVDIEDPNTLTSWLTREFIVPAGIPLENVHRLPVQDSDAVSAAAAYEAEIEQAGGLSLAVLGIGDNGHIAYNEPGSPPDSRTRVVELNEESIDQAAGYFDGHQVPTNAMTVGVETLTDASKIVVIVSGSDKQQILSRTLQGPVDVEVPASLLRRVPEKVTFIVDRDAASESIATLST